MPTIAAFHHATLTVTDLDRSVAWYEMVLGFSVLRRKLNGDVAKAMLLSDAGLLLVLATHGSLAVPGEFSERRFGLDHLAFAVANRAELDEWIERLEAHGVRHDGIVAGSTGELVAFRDPDNIALELYSLH